MKMQFYKNILFLKGIGNNMKEPYEIDFINILNNYYGQFNGIKDNNLVKVK